MWYLRIRPWPLPQRRLQGEVNPQAKRKVGVDSVKWPGRRQHQLLGERASSLAAVHRFEAAAMSNSCSQHSQRSRQLTKCGSRARTSGRGRPSHGEKPRSHPQASSATLQEGGFGRRSAQKVKIAVARPVAKLARLLREVLLRYPSADTEHTRIRGDTTNARCCRARVAPWLQPTERFEPF
jgi:hypothetical protein